VGYARCGARSTQEGTSRSWHRAKGFNRLCECIFKSETTKDLRAFAERSGGSRAFTNSRERIEKAIKSKGFQLWRPSQKAQIPATATLANHSAILWHRSNTGVMIRVLLHPLGVRVSLTKSGYNPTIRDQVFGLPCPAPFLGRSQVIPQNSGPIEPCAVFARR